MIRYQLRVTRSARRLACGHAVSAGTTIARKRRSWLCPVCQRWVRPKTHAEILAVAAARMDEEMTTR